MNIDAFLDLSGLKCPLPILKTQQRLRTLASGSTLRIACTDAQAQADFVAFAEMTGHRLLGMYQLASRYYFVLRTK